MRWALVIGLLAMAVGATGCMTAASQGYYAATGASPRFFEIKDLGGPVALDRYQSVAIEPFDPSPMLGAIPPDMLARVQQHAIEYLTKARLFAGVGASPGAKPALVIRGKFMDYDSGGSALRVVGVSENPFLTAQIQIVDAGTGQVLGIAMVTGTVKSVARTGNDQLAEGVGKAIRGLLEQHHTKPPKEK